MKILKITSIILVISFFLFLILSFNLNLLDSDSGREIQRTLSLVNYHQLDNGPLISQLIYSFFVLLSPINFLFLIKLLNPIIFIFIIYFSLKILNNFNVKESNKLLFIFLFLSVLPIFLLVFYLKPYLFLFFFLILSFYYFSNYIKKKNYKYLFFSCLFLSISILVKNHAFPFILYPFIFLSFEFIKKRKFDFKAIFYCILPIFLILFPFIFLNIKMFGMKFWHFPNTWFFTKGLNSYMATNFWHFPKVLTLEYFIGHKDFLIASVPLSILPILFFIYAIRYNKVAFKFLSILLVLSILPFIFGVMPHYQQYNYIVSLILILSIPIVIGFFKKYKYFTILTYFVIFLMSCMLITSNAFYVIDLNEKSNKIIKEFNEFESQHDIRNNILLARDFKLQPFTKKESFFLGIDNLKKEDIINILSDSKKENNFKYSLDKNNIDFLLFYKDKQYNEIYYNILMSFFDLNFSMNKFEQNFLLEKIYDGEYIVIFKYKK